MKKFLFIFLFPLLLQAANIEEIGKILSSKAPFNYEISPIIVKGNAQNAPVLLCLHGYGGDNSIGQVVHSFGIENDIVSFNFPDYSLFERNISDGNTTFGSIQELLPFFYILKKLIVEGKQPSVHL